MKVFQFEDIKYYVGQSAKENWELLDIAIKENPNYIWFHLNSFASPYVIMWLSIDDLNELNINQYNQYIQYGANLCKEYSKYKYLKDIKIMYTSVNKLSKVDKLGEVDITGKYNIIKI